MISILHSLQNYLKPLLSDVLDSDIILLEQDDNKSLSDLVKHLIKYIIIPDFSSKLKDLFTPIQTYSDFEEITTLSLTLLRSFQFQLQSIFCHHDH
jgi:hypothetical protein